MRRTDGRRTGQDHAERRGADRRRNDRPGPSLRVRVAAWVAGATAVLMILVAVSAFVAVRTALRSDLQEALRRDVGRVAAAYDAAEAGRASSARPGPTGRVHVQLYGPDGRLFAASESAFEGASAALPAAVVGGAPADWRGELDGTALQAATAPFRYGTVAVLADASHIGSALRGVASTLALAGAALLALALPVAWVAARAATTPIRRLAASASRLGPEDLQPLGLAVRDDDVGRLAVVLDALLTRLREARDAQRRFLAETSHELRTPLTSLRGFLARARRTAGPEAERDLADAERIAASMARLVEDLLELSRGRLVRELDLRLVDVGPEVARPVVAEFDGVRLGGGGEALVLGERERLRQALRNLVANAVRATGREGTVTVAWRSAEGGVDLEVRDDGPGIPPGVADRLFEPFQPGPGGGTGLGLAIAKQLVESHGGRIATRSAPGATTFTITLPNADATGDDAAGDEAADDAPDDAAHDPTDDATHDPGDATTDDPGDGRTGGHSGRTRG